MGQVPLKRDFLTHFRLEIATAKEEHLRHWRDGSKPLTDNTISLQLEYLRDTYQWRDYHGIRITVNNPPLAKNDTAIQQFEAMVDFFSKPIAEKASLIRFKSSSRFSSTPGVTQRRNYG